VYRRFILPLHYKISLKSGKTEQVSSRGKASSFLYLEGDRSVSEVKTTFFHIPSNSLYTIIEPFDTVYPELLTGS
jgi:hypothetical protein